MTSGQRPYIVNKINKFKPRTKKPFGCWDLPTAVHPHRSTSISCSFPQQGKCPSERRNVNMMKWIVTITIQKLYFLCIILGPLITHGLASEITMLSNIHEWQCRPIWKRIGAGYEDEVRKDVDHSSMGGIDGRPYRIQAKPGSSLEFAHACEDLDVWHHQSKFPVLWEWSQTRCQDCAYGRGRDRQWIRKRLWFLSTGMEKARALKQCVEEASIIFGTVSMLQLHRHGIIVCDDDSPWNWRWVRSTTLRILKRNISPWTFCKY